jgi:hypothetical protein
MTKLCPRGKAAAKRKFAVYPSAYANAYASKICAGKIKDPSGVKRKDFRGPKPSKAMGGRIYKANGGPLRQFGERKPQYITKKEKPQYITKKEKPQYITKKEKPQYITRKAKMGGGMMKMPRAMYKKGGIAKGCGAVMNDRRKVTKVF